MYIFVVVKFDALAEASDFRIERRQVVFLRWMQDSKLESLRHQFASRLNAHTYNLSPCIYLWNALIYTSFGVSCHPSYLVAIMISMIIKEHFPVYSSPQLSHFIRCTWSFYTDGLLVYIGLVPEAWLQGILAGTGIKKWIDLISLHSLPASYCLSGQNNDFSPKCFP